jgi:hypothetical protein
MRYVHVTIVHQPDAGQYSKGHFAYPDVLGHTDETTAREFAFKALDEGEFRKGLIRVAFPEGPSYSFRFVRTGLMGYNLIEASEQPQELQLV